MSPSSQPTDYTAKLAWHREQTLGRYTQQQKDAAIRLFDTAYRMLDTGGGSTCARLLLGLYNGRRFPFDLTDLRLLDSARLDAAITALHMDAAHTWCEIHVLLDAILNVPLGKSTGHTLEAWAYDLGLKGRCTKANLSEVRAGAFWPSVVTKEAQG